MAHTKAGGSTKLGRDSASKRLGVKVFGGGAVQPGNIIVRQRGRKMVAGDGTILGKDYTIMATRAGRVVFQTKQITNFTGNKDRRKIVTVSE